VRIGKGRKASFLATGTAIGKKNNAVDRPSPRYHTPQGVMQRVLMAGRRLLLRPGHIGLRCANPTYDNYSDPAEPSEANRGTPRPSPLPD